MGGPNQPPDLAAYRERIAQGREKLKAAHQRGVPGIQVCTALTDLLDGVILDLYQAALADAENERVNSVAALVAHGGFGRRDVAPYSDVDLMLLHTPGTEDVVAPVARRFTHSIYDVGLQLGFTLRTSKQACQLSVRDATIFTSLAESRFLAGSVSLFTRYMSSFRRTASRNTRRLITSIILARREERTQYGETGYLLEPNVKRSRGTLRELQMIRWIGFARYGHPELESLENMGVLLPQEKRRLREAREYLLRLRNELHFHAGRAQDVLDKSEQLRLADLRGFTGSDAVLPVEKFMQQYFEYTSYVRYTSAQFGKAAIPEGLTNQAFNLLATRRMGAHFKAGATHIRATRRGMKALKGNLKEVLRLLELASLTEKRIHHDTWQAIRVDMMESDDTEVSPEAVAQFLRLMSQSGTLSEQLRRLHELRVLEKIVPPMKHARALLQFNEYHKYTVDEHSLRAVEKAADMVSDPGPRGRVYRRLNKHRRTLHLAVLMHDLGKGFPEDHSELGAVMASQVAERLGLPQEESDLLQLLIRKHLVMAHVAFRQNLDDDSVIARFAGDVGSTEALQLLYLLTCADIDAVGPGVLNDWKLGLLTELYRRAKHQLSGAEFGEDSSLQAKRDAVLRRVADDDDQEAWTRLVDSLPLGYLYAREPEIIWEDMSRLRRLDSDQVAAWGRYVQERKAVEITFAAHEHATEGIFHRLAGALASKRTKILSAEIHTLADGLVLDRFHVDDLDFAHAPPESRLEEISEALVQAVNDPSGKPPRIRQVWTKKEGGDRTVEYSQPTQVRFDNNTSDKHTIVNVFAYDRLGLLYCIARALFEQGLSVHHAKIATYVDQVVDVFYVTDQKGDKVETGERLDAIRSHILGALESLDSV